MLKCIDMALQKSFELIINTRDDTGVSMYRAVPVVSFAHHLSAINANQRRQLATAIYDTPGVVGEYVRRKFRDCADVELVDTRVQENLLREVARALSALCVAVCNGRPSHENILFELASSMGVKERTSGSTLSSILVARNEDELATLARSLCTYCVLSTQPSDEDLLADIADMLCNPTSHWSMADLLVQTDTGVLVTHSCERCCSSLQNYVNQVLNVFSSRDACVETLKDVAMRMMIGDVTFYQLWSSMRMQFDTSPILLRWMENGNPTLTYGCILLSAFSNNRSGEALENIESVLQTPLQRARISAIISALQLPTCTYILNLAWERIDYEKDIIQPEHVQTLWNISAYLLLDATPPYAVLESMSVCVLEHTHAYEDLYIHSTRAVRSLLINRVCGLQTNKRIAETLETTFCRLIGKPSYGCCADTWPRGRNAVARILQLNRHSGTALSLSTDVQHEFCREIVSTDTVVNATIAFEESARKHFASTPFQPDSQTLRIRSIFKLERYCINTGNMCIRLMSRN